MAVAAVAEPETLVVDDGHTMLRWATDLFPICRSLTGAGVRETLTYLQALLPELEIHSIPSGTEVYDWTVPNEWNIDDAFVATESGERVIDFQQCNLHVVGYSEPVDTHMSFRELDQHLYHLSDQPNAIPYVTSYYARRWGFCLTHEQYIKLSRQPERVYHVRIDSSLKPGNLNYAELVLPGESSEEVFFSTYICHPSLANNELSGPCVQTALARWISDELPSRRLTYRFYFGPETIGAIAYLSRNLEAMKENTLAGFVLSCLGDDREYSYLSSRNGDTLADRVAKHVLGEIGDYRSYSYRCRGSDERQYCSPGIDLPVCTLSRSKFMEYPEYHTSLDNLDLISAEGFDGSFSMLKELVAALDANFRPRCVVPCEPQLGKRGLYPTLSTKQTRQVVGQMMDLIAYSDGSRDLLEIAERIESYVGDLVPIAHRLVDAGVLERSSHSENANASA